MDKRERLAKLKEAQEKISNEIEELKNEIENEKPKYWKPVNGDELHYWHVGAGYGLVVYYDENKIAHKRQYEAGELFPTKELCEEHQKERIYKEKWKRLSVESGEDKIPWDGIHKHWFVQYNAVDDRLNIDTHICSFDANVYFSSYEDAKDAIKEIGEENVKRYILGVKE